MKRLLLSIVVMAYSFIVNSRRWNHRYDGTGHETKNQAW